MYIYGKNAVKDALNKEEIKEAFLYKNFNDKDILDKLINQKIKINYKEKRELDNMEKGNHQGIILKVNDYEYVPLKEIIQNDVIVMLDHLEDPHNFGAIVRTCEAAGVNSIIIPKDRSVKVNSTVIKISVGSIENMKIAVVNNLVQTINKLKKQGYWIIGTDMHGTDFKKIDYSGKIVIIIGRESTGLSRLTRDNCDFMAAIPMNGTVNSLNASVAAALVIFEAVRNR